MIFNLDGEYKLTSKEISLCRNGWYAVYEFCSEDNFDIFREMSDWLFENNMSYKQTMRDAQHEIVTSVWRVWVKGQENAMAFKLRWA